MAASMDFVATVAPQNVVATLSLQNGTRYTAQNIAQASTVFVREQAAAPQAGEAAFRIEPGQDFTLQPDGTPIWIWADSAAAIILTEAP